MVFLKSAFLLVLVTLLSGVSAEWRWSGKVAVVTGASSGIGEAIALNLADRGVIVVALARRKEKLEALSSRTNGTIHPMVCDFLKEEDILRSFRTIEQTLGGVDILVNNAGVAKLGKLTGNTEDLKTVLDLHVLGLTIATREALKTMRNRTDDGHIININSITGHYVTHRKGIYVGLYPASKFAVTALSQSLAHELSDDNSKIKVSSISPGTVDTYLIKYILTNIPRGYDPPFPKLVPDDIAEAVVYILSTRPNVQIPELTIQPVGQTFC